MTMTIKTQLNQILKGISLLPLHQATSPNPMERPNLPLKWKEYNRWSRAKHTDMEIMAFILAASLVASEQESQNYIPSTSPSR